MAEILGGYWQILDRSGKKIILLSPPDKCGSYLYLQDVAILNSYSLMHFTKKQNNVQAFVNLHIRPIILFVDNTSFKKTLLDFIFS